MKFYCCRLHARSAFIATKESDVILRACRLFQEFCCMAFAIIENQLLTFLRYNQTLLETEPYRNVMNALTDQNRLENPKLVSYWAQDSTTLS